MPENPNYLMDSNIRLQMLVFASGILYNQLFDASSDERICLRILSSYRILVVWIAMTHAKQNSMTYATYWEIQNTSGNIILDLLSKKKKKHYLRPLFTLKTYMKEYVWECWVFKEYQLSSLNNMTRTRATQWHGSCYATYFIRIQE